jgi:enamine deaminase RidA (YjgF/YER057c/UK114 family)
VTYPRTFIALLTIAGIGVFASAIFASNAKAPVRRYLEPRSASADADKPPFSGAVLVGDTLYLSGNIGLEPGNKVPKEAATEARLLMESFEKRLAAAGMTMDDLVYVTVYSSDVSDYAAFNAEYRKHFHHEFPARAYIGAGKLLFGARWEMQGVAVRRRP